MRDKVPRSITHHKEVEVVLEVEEVMKEEVDTEDIEDEDMDEDRYCITIVINRDI